jgi:hypothetical protein
MGEERAHDHRVLYGGDDPQAGSHRAGAQVRRLGDGPGQVGRGTGGPRHAHLEGFDLHADV